MDIRKKTETDIKRRAKVKVERNINLPQVGFRPVHLLTISHKFKCFDVNSCVDIDCARLYLLQTC